MSKETCPMCGKDLIGVTVCTLPPVDYLRCFNCGYQEKVEDNQHVSNNGTIDVQCNDSITCGLSENTPSVSESLKYNNSVSW